MEKVPAFARMIVAKRLLVIALVVGVAHVLVATGAIPVDISEQAEQWTTSIIDVVALIGGILWAQTGVTPADPKLAPMSTHGLPLVEALRPDLSHDDGNVRRVRRAERSRRTVGGYQAGDKTPAELDPPPKSWLQPHEPGEHRRDPDLPPPR